jgi:hypothetical protein
MEAYMIVALTPPAAGGEWTESVITEFAGGSDGRYPSNLVLASNGVLYGLANKKKGWCCVPIDASGCCRIGMDAHDDCRY